MSHFTSDELNTFTQALKNGEVVAAPAEGVYGYCADPFNPSALKALTNRKKRAANKGLIVLISHTTDLAKVCSLLGDDTLYKIYEIWGQRDASPTTLVLPSLPDLSPLLTGERDTIAVRLPDCDYMKEYLDAWGGPLVSTSLNESGKDPITKGKDVPEDITSLTLEDPLDGGVSKIYDVRKGEWLR